jgi:hypothetical protein
MRGVVGGLELTGMLRRIAALLAGASTTVLMVTGSAAASTGSAYYSADQAGYVATGAKFKFAGGTVRLPDASHYARELGRVGVSIQLWDTRRPRRPRHCHRQYA